MIGDFAIVFKFDLVFTLLEGCGGFLGGILRLLLDHNGLLRDDILKGSLSFHMLNYGPSLHNSAT